MDFHKSGHIYCGSSTYYIIVVYFQVKVDLDMGYASGSGVVEPNKSPISPYSISSITNHRTASISAKTLVTILDESKTTGIPSLEALKARSQYQAKILEYYQVSYLSPLSSPKVELKVK